MKFILFFQPPTLPKPQIRPVTAATHIQPTTTRTTQEPHVHHLNQIEEKQVKWNGENRVENFVEHREGAPKENQGPQGSKGIQGPEGHEKVKQGDKPSESGDGTSISLHEIQQVYHKGTVSDNV